MNGLQALSLVLSGLALALAAPSLVLSVVRARHVARFYRSLFSRQDEGYRQAEDRQFDADVELFGLRRAQELAFDRDLTRSSSELRAVYFGQPPATLLAAALKREARGD